METTNYSSENGRKTVRAKKENQVIFIEYEKAKDGHKITVTDSYRNVIGRIYQQYNSQEKKMEFTFRDHEGKSLFRHEHLSALKEQIMRNKTVLLQQAHDRRIEQKRKRMLNVKEFPAIDFGKRKRAVQSQKPTLSEKEQKQIDRNIKEIERENELRLEREERLRELEELREDKGQSREQELSR